MAILILTTLVCLGVLVGSRATSNSGLTLASALVLAPIIYYGYFVGG